MDPNLLYDKERFIGSCSLVQLIESENGFTQQLYIPKKAKRPVSSVTREGEHNIGGLGEGTLHLVLKNYISANRENQEIKYKGKYIDVLLDGKAYEVQTRSFGSLKSKLKTFLPELPVTIVFPAIMEKRIAWTDPETGELTPCRKSPKKESVYSIFNELIYIKDFLSNQNLSFCVFLLGADETKLLCGYSADKKKGSVRLNRVPTDLFSVEYFETSKDFIKLLPDTEEFTVKSLASHAKITPDLARKMIYCLCHADIIKHTHTEKREKFYSVI